MRARQKSRNGEESWRDGLPFAEACRPLFGHAEMTGSLLAFAAPGLAKKLDLTRMVRRPDVRLPDDRDKSDSCMVWLVPFRDSAAGSIALGSVKSGC